ncbi:MAG: MetQ/NlpA family ABC transporter substrate-binding protein [Deltaproteobacteria bacterium]|nr:MetQ/NlpA family ABC transporter substrate-binding protein [Deltaproteobacteria bacterium]
MKRLLTLALAALLAAFSTAALAQNSITVGTTSGADVEILEKAQEVAKARGLDVKIVEFSDYVLPNKALVDGDIDLNSFQHIPFLDEFNANTGANLVSIGVTYISPIAFYSDKLKKLDELKDGDTVVIPNDPTNGGRSLLLLQKAGFVKVKPEAGLNPSPLDVVENRLNLKIVEVEASQTPQARADAAVVAINNTFAEAAGLNAVDNSIYMEDFDSPYANIIVARPADKDNPAYKTFVESYQSPEVAQFILERFKGATVPVFEYPRN